MKIGSNPTQALLALARELGIKINEASGRRTSDFKSLREAVVMRQLVDGMTWQQAIAAELDERKDG